MDSSGNLYVLEKGRHRVLKLSFPAEKGVFPKSERSSYRSQKISMLIRKGSCRFLTVRQDILYLEQTVLLKKWILPPPCREWLAENGLMTQKTTCT